MSTQDVVAPLPVLDLLSQSCAVTPRHSQWLQAPAPGDFALDASSHAKFREHPWQRGHSSWVIQERAGQSAGLHRSLHHDTELRSRLLSQHQHPGFHELAAPARQTVRCPPMPGALQPPTHPHIPEWAALCQPTVLALSFNSNPHRYFSSPQHFVSSALEAGISLQGSSCPCKSILR